MGKKRRADDVEAEVDLELCNKRADFDKLDALYSEVVGAAIIEVELLNQVKTFLVENKDTIKDDVKTKIDTKFLCALLVSYSAGVGPKDLIIYDILMSLERDFSVKMSSVQPFVWGNKSREHYEKLKTLGSSLHRINPNTVLLHLDGEIMWRTVLCHSKPYNEQYVRYDERFLLRLFSSIIHPASEMCCRQFVEIGGLSLLFSCTSSNDKPTRLMAYYLLQRYRTLAKELKVDDIDHKFEEKLLYIYMIDLFKQSLETEAPRISHIVSHFFARICKMLLHPDSPCYQTIATFLCSKPQVQLNKVPTLAKMLLSTSVKKYKLERRWILQLIAEGLIDPLDYNVFQNSSGMKLLQALFPTCMLEQDDRKLILSIMKSAVSMKSAAHDLFYRCNLHSWIASVIQTQKLTDWEKNYLSEIFLILVTNERLHLISRGADPTTSFIAAKMTSRMICGTVANFRRRMATNIESINAVIAMPWRMKGELAEKEEADDAELPDCGTHFEAGESDSETLN